MSHTCTVTKTTTASAVYILFTITNCDSCPWLAGIFTLYYWGLNSLYSLADAQKQQFTLRILSQYLNTIDVSKVTSAVQFDITIINYETFFGNSVFQFYNRRAKGYIQVDF